jgi:hypothetical protein
MDGLGRLMAMQNLSGEGARRDTDGEWRALHRRPDAPPLPDDEAGVVAGHRPRLDEQFRLRSLIARFGHR